jgi:hypothetical protein
MTNLSDCITENIKGKHFKERNSASEIVQIVEFRSSDGDRSSRAGVKVWYPLTDVYGFIDSDVFENYIPCSATEIERIRRLEKHSPTESNILTLDSAREARDKKEQAEAYEKSSHLADHIP